MHGGEGSIWAGRVDGGVGGEMRVRMVWRGRDGSQESICFGMKIIFSFVGGYACGGNF